MTRREIYEVIFLSWAFKKGIKHVFGIGRLILIALSVLSDAIFFKLSISIGITAIMLIHEWGHYFYAKRLKKECTYPVVFPFKGGAVYLLEEFGTYAESAKFRLAGLYSGVIASGLSGYIFFATGNRDFLIIWLIGVIIHILNALPIKPLDGGVFVLLGQKKRYFFAYATLWMILSAQISYFIFECTLSLSDFR